MSFHYSLMTVSMLMPGLFRYRICKDREEFEEYYEEMLQLVYSNGFSSVEVTSFEIDMLGLDVVRQKLEKSKLRVGSFICFDAFGTTSGEGFEARIEHGKKSVHIAQSLGTHILMLAPTATAESEQCSAKTLQDALARHFQPIAAYAKSLGVQVVIEDTADLRLHFCAAKDVAAVLKAVPDAKLVYDSGNLLMAEEEPVAYLEQFSDCLGYVHFKDMIEVPVGTQMSNVTSVGRTMAGAPIGTGVVDFQHLLQKLKQIEYNGDICLEFEKYPEESYSQSLQKTREYIQKIEALL